MTSEKKRSTHSLTNICSSFTTRVFLHADLEFTSVSVVKFEIHHQQLHSHKTLLAKHLQRHPFAYTLYEVLSKATGLKSDFGDISTLCLSPSSRSGLRASLCAAHLHTRSLIDDKEIDCYSCRDEVIIFNIVTECVRSVCL